VCAAIPEPEAETEAETEAEPEAETEAETLANDVGQPGRLEQNLVTAMRPLPSGVRSSNCETTPPATLTAWCAPAAADRSGRRR
jgi:hypothetical protein